MSQSPDTAREVKPFTHFGFGASESDDRTVNVQTVNPDGSPVDTANRPAPVPATAETPPTALTLVPTDDGGVREVVDPEAPPADASEGGEGKAQGTPAKD